MGCCFCKSHNVPISPSSSSDSPPRRYQRLPETIQPQRQPPQQPQPHYPASPNPAPPSHFPPTTKPFPSSSSSHIGTILGRPCVDISTLYTLERELGSGQFGITYLCTEKANGSKYACKSIGKRKLVSKSAIEDVRREVSILQHLTGQPNIVELKGAYEDKQNVHLVMELCAGGELFDRIVAKMSYSEREAAIIFRQIANVVHGCHFMGVMHRDVKPENFLMVSRDESSPLKVTDFGVSVFIEQGLFRHCTPNAIRCYMILRLVCFFRTRFSF